MNSKHLKPMKPMSELVKQWVIEHNGRMPETEQEWNQYLDIINHGKEYRDALIIEKKIGKKTMKRLGLKTPQEIKDSFKLNS